jgi:hypothetical protein
MADELDFIRASRRIERFLAWVAMAGTLLGAALGGWKWAAGFALGAAAAWFNFRRLKRMVGALGGGPAPSPARLAFRLFLLGGCAYVIVRFSAVPGLAVIAGLFVLIAAIFIEIGFELVYARKRTLDHQDL